jgi:ribose transport system ATP-binding protein
MPTQQGVQGRTALHTRGLCKAFGRTRALDDVEFEVAAGSIHALVGGNGSGKSTLIKILAGVESADSGAIAIGGHPMPIMGHGHGPAASSAAGLRFVHQNLGTFPDLSVTENLALGHGFVRRIGQRIDWPAEHRRAAALIDRFGIHATPATRMSALGPADNAMVAIARALQDQETANEGILVLDEPTASLPRAEVERVLAALRRYAAAGQTIVFVGHRLDEVLDIADDVTVLRDGRTVARHSATSLTPPDLVREMLGRDLAAEQVGAPDIPTGPPLLSVRDLAAGPLDGIDLDVWPGEVVGVAGLLGSGRTTLLSVLFGCRAASRGSMTFDGTQGIPGSVRAAMHAGLALVPESRVDEGIFTDLSVRHNLSASVVGQYWKRWRLAKRDERIDSIRLVDEFGIRPASDEPAIGSLSGGNQQKVILARWLRRNPRLLLLDEPTQGVDVGARASIHQQVRAWAAAGASALYVSSDFEELTLVCDRVVVLNHGRLDRQVVAPNITSEALTSLCYAERALA